MKLIDLSRALHHKAQRLPNHSTIEVYPFSTHAEKRVVDGYEFSSGTMLLPMGDQGGTHMDAPVHLDETPGAKTIEQMPPETLFTEALCLDLTGVPDKTDITVVHLEVAEKALGVSKQPKDVVLL